MLSHSVNHGLTWFRQVKVRNLTLTGQNDVSARLIMFQSSVQFWTNCDILRWFTQHTLRKTRVFLLSQYFRDNLHIFFYLIYCFIVLLWSTWVGQPNFTDIMFFDNVWLRLLSQILPVRRTINCSLPSRKSFSFGATEHKTTFATKMNAILHTQVGWSKFCGLHILNVGRTAPLWQIHFCHIKGHRTGTNQA